MCVQINQRSIVRRHENAKQRAASINQTHSQGRAYVPNINVSKWVKNSIGRRALLIPTNKARRLILWIYKLKPVVLNRRAVFVPQDLGFWFARRTSQLHNNSLIWSTDTGYDPSMSETPLQRYCVSSSDKLITLNGTRNSQWLVNELMQCVIRQQNVYRRTTIEQRLCFTWSHSAPSQCGQCCHRRAWFHVLASAGSQVEVCWCVTFPSGFRWFTKKQSVLEMNSSTRADHNAFWIPIGPVNTWTEYCEEQTHVG